MKNLLIVFVKYPEPGRVKTRLANGIGDTAAADVYRRLVALTMERSAPSVPPDYDRIVYADPARSLECYRNWLTGAEGFAVQTGDSLGERMHTAFLNSFAGGYRKVCLIGSDCPDVGASLIEEAFSLLDGCDTVLGPAEDGGYYLLALTRDIEPIFTGIDWGTERVMQQTLARLDTARVSRSLLPRLRDVDRVEDLEFFRNRGMRCEQS